MYGSSSEGEPDDFAYGVDLFNAGYYWEAHVFFERSWREATDAGEPTMALFFQALVQLAAALVNRRRGKPTGEAKLRARSLEKLRQSRRELGGSILGVPVDELMAELSDGRTPVLRICS